METVSLKDPGHVRDMKRATNTMNGFVNAWAAAEYLRGLGFHELQLHILAEERGQNRPQILNLFPKVGPKFRARYPLPEEPKETPRVAPATAARKRG